MAVCFCMQCDTVSGVVLSHLRSVLIRQLKEAQHNLMNVIMSIADQAIPDRRALRDFRAKYPDDVLLDQISGE